MTALLLFTALAFAEDPAESPADMGDVKAFVAAAALDFHADGVHADPAVVDAAYQEACDTGYPLACERTWGQGALQEAATALAEACDAGDPGACLVVGWSKAQMTPGIYHQESPEAAAAEPFFARACAAGLERACVARGALYQLGVGVEKDAETALSLHTTACQQGEMAGCRRLGALYHIGLGVDRDLDKARKYYGKACESGYLAGCNSMGLVTHLSIDGTKPDPPTAIGFYIRACDGGHASACNNLEKLYAAGMRAEEDPPGRLALWEAGCDREVPAACANGGNLANDPLMGDAASLERAQGLWTRGCDLEDSYSCGQLGASLFDTDFDRGRGMVRDACEAGHGEACRRLAQVLADKTHPQFAMDRAASLYSKGCELNDTEACYGLADAHWKGQGVDKDRERARELYEHVCTRGIEAACKRAR